MRNPDSRIAQFSPHALAVAQLTSPVRISTITAANVQVYGLSGGSYAQVDRLSRHRFSASAI